MLYFISIQRHKIKIKFPNFIPLFYCVNMWRVINLSPRPLKWKIILIFNDLRKNFKLDFQNWLLNTLKYSAQNIYVVIYAHINALTIQTATHDSAYGLHNTQNYGTISLRNQKRNLRSRQEDLRSWLRSSKRR